MHHIYILYGIGFWFEQHHTTDWPLLILKLHFTWKVTISLINNEVQPAYIGYNLRVILKGMIVIIIYSLNGIYIKK
jgi:hypothetical protein